MRPFFSSHGYTLYRSMDRDPWDTCPEPLPKAAEDPKYPYARRGYEQDKDNLFSVGVHSFSRIPYSIDYLIMQHSQVASGVQEMPLDTTL